MGNKIWIGTEWCDQDIGEIIGRMKPILCGNLSKSLDLKRAIEDCATPLNEDLSLQWRDMDLSTIIGQAALSDLIRQSAPISHVIHVVPKWDLETDFDSKTIPLDMELRHVRLSIDTLLSATRAAYVTMSPYKNGCYTLLTHPQNTAESPLAIGLTGWFEKWLKASLKMWEDVGLELKCSTQEAWIARLSELDLSK